MQARKYADLIREYAAINSLDPAMVFAIVSVESHFNERARSTKGAIGLMQLMPKTAGWIAECLQVSKYNTDDLFDPRCNIAFGTFYLRYLFDRFPEDWQAFAAYNAGEGVVSAWLKEGIDEKEIPYSETRNYVKKVQRAICYYRGKKYVAFD